MPSGAREVFICFHAHQEGNFPREGMKDLTPFCKSFREVELKSAHLSERGLIAFSQKVREKGLKSFTSFTLWDDLPMMGRL